MWGGRLMPCLLKSGEWEQCLRIFKKYIFEGKDKQIKQSSDIYEMKRVKFGYNGNNSLKNWEEIGGCTLGIFRFSKKDDPLQSFTWPLDKNRNSAKFYAVQIHPHEKFRCGEPMPNFSGKLPPEKTLPYAYDHVLQGWPNYGPPTILIRPAKHHAHFFKHNVFDCGQQCNVIGCCSSLVDLSAVAALSCKLRYKSVNKMVWFYCY